MKKKTNPPTEAYEAAREQYKHAKVLGILFPVVFCGVLFGMIFSHCAEPRTDNGRDMMEQVMEQESAWKTISIERDALTGETGYVAHSELATGKGAEHPHSDIEGMLGYYCEGLNEGISLAYPDATFPVFYEWSFDIFMEKNGRIMWDKTLPTTLEVFDNGDGEGVVFQNLDISNLMQHNSVTIELPFMNSGAVIFEYSLRGAGEAIMRVRESNGCTGG